MNKILSHTATALFIGATMFLSSCTKDDDHSGCGNHPAEGTNETQKARIKDMLGKLPITKITDLPGRFAMTHPKGNIAGKVEDGGWNFTDPHGGNWNFSDPHGLTYTSTTNTIFIPYTAFGSNSANVGTVVAGGSSLDMNYTFCFSADEDALGLNLYNLNGSDFTGLSLVIGVSGDFDELANADSTSDLFDFFHGLAFYVVYDSPAEGDYDVVSWLDGLTNLNIDSHKAFAFVFDFRDAKLYMSTSGTINVSGGNMNYDGEYLEIDGFFDDSGTFDWNNLNYTIVPGFGTMGCN